LEARVAAKSVTVISIGVFRHGVVGVARRNNAVLRSIGGRDRMLEKRDMTQTMDVTQAKNANYQYTIFGFSLVVNEKGN
jgi:hypothetical protein